MIPGVIVDALSERFRVEGMNDDTARVATYEIGIREQSILTASARTVFGINADELGSPWAAAVSSLLFFSVGAVVPLVPWFFTEGSLAVLLSAAATAAASLVVGAAVSRTSGRPWWRGAVRQFLIVVGASAVTYGVGKTFGTAVS